MKGVFEALAADLQSRGLVDVREAFIDGSFAPAKKGGRRSETAQALENREAVCLVAELPQACCPL